MFRQIRWWIAASLAAMTVLSLFGPIDIYAQETTGDPPGTLPIATVIVDTAIYVEPTAESAQLEHLTAGANVTLMDSPLTSVFDGQLWVQVASLQSLGFMPLSSLSTTPEDPQPAPEPLIVAWKLVYAEEEVPCRAGPQDESEVVATLYPGQEVGLTAEPVDGWQAVVCDSVAGFVPASVFDVPPPPAETPVGETPSEEAPPVDEPVDGPVEPVDEPADEPVDEPVDEPTDITVTTVPEVPTAEPTEAVAETPVATEEPSASIASAPVPESPTPEVAALSPDPVATVEPQVMAIIGGGTGYVRGTDGDGLRCRAGASTVSATITVLSEGAAVTSRGAVSGSWQPVYCAGQNGFVWAEYVGNSPGTSSSTGSVGTVRNTNGDWLRCRAGAGISNAIITALAPGAKATIRGSMQGSWVPVICGGQNGFVHADFFGVGSSAGSGTSGRFSVGQAIHVAGTNGDGVRFRSGAGLGFSTISVLPEGSGLNARAGSSGEWIAVTRGGVNGFIHTDYLASGAGSSSSGSGTVGSTSLAAGSHGRVTEALRLRSGASLSSPTLTVAPAGTIIKITSGRSNGFYGVNWDGMSGYMHSDYLVWSNAALSPRSGGAPSSTTPGGNAGSGSGTVTGQAIANYAMRYLGYPYVWGARGPNSFDCAGFVYWVNWKMTGINLVGGVINQYTYGRPVPWGQLQPGDIVNFSNTYQPGLSHNGIYIGNNQFVHASNPTNGVMVSNLTSPYYAARFYGARRII